MLIIPTAVAGGQAAGCVCCWLARREIEGLSAAAPPTTYNNHPNNWGALLRSSAVSIERLSSVRTGRPKTSAVTVVEIHRVAGGIQYIFTPK